MKLLEVEGEGARAPVPHSWRCHWLGSTLPPSAEASSEPDAQYFPQLLCSKLLMSEVL